jgi:hypothetical protein
MNSVSTHMHLYQQGHVTAKGNAGHWLWALLWALLRGLPPRLNVLPLTVATPSLRSQLHVKKYVQGTDALPSPQPMHLRRHVHDNCSP